MKNRSKLGMLGAGFAMAVAGLMGTAQATQPLSQATQQTATGGQSELKATQERKRDKGAININALGGLDFKPLLVSDFGMSPKEYGLSIASNGGIKKSNRLRLSHNAKLKRRRG